MRVVTTEVQLHAFSIDGFKLPTFQKGRVKTIYNRFGCVVAKYVYFQYITVLERGLEYKNHYLKIK